MTIDEIKKIPKQISDLGYTTEIEFTIHHKLFDKEVKYFIQVDEKTGKAMNEDIMENVIFLQNISEEELKRISKLAFKNYELSIKVTSYGMVSDELYKRNNGDNFLANQEYFGIYKQEDVYKKMNLIQINMSDYYSNDRGYLVFSSLQFDAPWDEEHGMYFEYTNMKFVGTA